MNINTTREQVEWVLINYPATRNSDDLLVLCVYGKFYGIDTKNVSFSDLMRNRLSWGLPSTESIRRSRQKITEINPTLRGTKSTEKARFEKQNEYIGFAKS